MQLWEQGLVDLDAPANDYLRAYRLIPAKASFRPATVRHLLTHTAGIPEVVRASPTCSIRLRPFGGRSRPQRQVGEPLPSLAEYYRGGLRIVVEPGTAFAYTNHGFATLGQIVEDVSGMPLDRYFREHIFEPLGMADTDLVRSERVASRLATGYVLGPSGAKAVPDRDWIGRGAGGIYSTAPRHGALRRGAARRRRQRARLGAQAGDAGDHVRAPLPAGSADPGDRPGVLPRRRRRASRRRARRDTARLQLEHPRWLPTTASASSPSPTGRAGAMAWLPTELAAPAAASCSASRRGRAHRCPATPRDLG